MMKPLQLAMRKNALAHIIVSLTLGVAVLSNTALAANRPVKVEPDAPDVYVVKQGDTLWDISRKFTRENWRWPELWRMNRGQVKNPHLIYPGQRIRLDRATGRLSLDDKVHPQVYVGPTPEAVSTIPRYLIEPFLIHPQVVEKEYLDDAGTIVANDYKQVNASSGEEVFAKNLKSDATSWEIFRPLQPVKDPETGTVLAYEGVHVGSAEVAERTNPVTLRLTSSKMEVNAGDRLLPVRKPQLFAFAPHSPENKIQARIIGIRDGISEAGPREIIVINAGSDAGLDEGSIVALYRTRGEGTYLDTTPSESYPTSDKLKPHEDLPLLKQDAKPEDYALPPRRAGLAMVFKTSRKLSYALIMESESSLKIGDEIHNP